MVAIVRLGALLGLVLLSSCSRHLNISRIESDIQDDIERQGRRLQLKDVICPNGVPKQAEMYFRCVGVLPDDSEFTINVTQQDDQGTVSWDVPSSKVLINLASLEETIQEDIRDAVGKSLAIDCRDTYRVSKRGDSFECDVVGAGNIAAGRVESVLVKVNGDSNLEWQELVISTAPVPAPTQGVSSQGTAGGTTTAPSETAPPAAAPAADGETPDTSTATTAANPAAESAAVAEEEDDEGDRQ
ncbi:MAG: DUF4333 domain-containing protein [Leptolyngbyaceae cyanobacterium MAG.088]|nr:DUF4333 domain-containing protein [Leptolyngbyaceae cyanobacterium MAG.088]